MPVLNAFIQCFVIIIKWPRDKKYYTHYSLPLSHTQRGRLLKYKDRGSFSAKLNYRSLIIAPGVSCPYDKRPEKNWKTGVGNNFTGGVCVRVALRRKSPLAT